MKFLLLGAIAFFSLLGLQAQNLCDEPGRFIQEKYTVSLPEESKNIVYGSSLSVTKVQTDLKLDVYQPGGDTKENRPCVLIAHGGSFVGGSKENGDVVQISEALTKRGYVVIAINYRLGLDFTKLLTMTKEEKEAELLKAALRASQDGLAAVRWIKKGAATGNPYKVDTNRVIFAGVSAGGFVALHTSYLDKESEIAEMTKIDVLKELDGLYGKSGNEGYSSKVMGVVNLCGALGKAKWIEKGNVPVISMHGTADDVVPYAYGGAGVAGIATLPVEGSYLVDSAARSVGVDSKLYTWEGAGHVPFSDGTNQKVFMDTTINFVTRNIYKWVCGVTAIENLREELVYRVYPNPALDGKLNIETGGEIFNIKLNDILGRSIAEMKSSEYQNGVTFSDLPAGVYTLTITGKGKSATEKVIIQ